MSTVAVLIVALIIATLLVVLVVVYILLILICLLIGSIKERKEIRRYKYKGQVLDEFIGYRKQEKRKKP